MTGKEGKALFLCILLLLPLTAIAKDFAVSIEPRDFSGIPEIYRDEIVSYQIKAVNFSSEKITGLHVELVAEPELSIIDSTAENQNNTEVQRKTFDIEQIMPGEIAVIDFFLKAKADSSEKAVVSANYGFLAYTNSTVSFLKIIPSNIIVSVNAKKPSFAPLEENSLLLSIANNSGKPISEIQAMLVLPRDFETRQGAFLLAGLAPGQKSDGNEFVFSAKELAQGNRRVALLVSFNDEKGKHTLDKEAKVQVSSFSSSLIIILVAVAIIIIFVLIFEKGTAAGKIEKKTEKQK